MQNYFNFLLNMFKCVCWFIFYRFSKHQASNVPEMKEVADFMEFMLGDCSGDEDKTFLTLRVHTVFYLAFLCRINI